MRVGEQLREMWRQARRGGQDGRGREAEAAEIESAELAAAAEAERKTLALPAILSPVQFPGRHLPKPTPVNLRRFAETPVVRRAINVIKDRIAAMDWQVRVRRGFEAGDVGYVERKLRALRRMLEEPNATDSFRTLIEQAIEDALTGGFGAIEMEPTGDPERPAMLWPVDGASIRINARWDGQEDVPRYAQAMPGQLESSAVELLDSQLMYIRMNPRSFTPFGLGPLEVAFETVNQFLSAHRFAGKLAANAVAQYALWLNEATPVQHDRLIRWWQDEIEGTGRVPLISTEQKPEVLRFAQGTDADLRLAWQEFLIRMVANAFGLPPLMLGLEADVNQSTASEMADEAFRGAISPLAILLAGTLRGTCSEVHRLAGVRVRLQRAERARRGDGVKGAGAVVAGGRADGERGAGDAGAGAVRSRERGNKGTRERENRELEHRFLRNKRESKGWFQGRFTQGRGRRLWLKLLHSCSLGPLFPCSLCERSENMRLEAMAVEIPHVAKHPNRVPFEGVLTVVNAASDKAPAGARGHRVMLTREAAEKALPSLLGMAVDYRPGWDGHDARRKIGLLTEADVVGQRLVVRGYLYARDFPEVA